MSKVYSSIEDINKEISNEISFSDEAALLLHPLSSKIKTILKKNNAFIAGGAITSIFTGAPIKDFDIFFRSETDFKTAEREFFSLSKAGIYTTPNAITLKNVDNTSTIIQLIRLKTSFVEEPRDIFKEFDFIACCGAYDFQIGGFILHENFLKHLAKRELVFNPTHKYPISSLLRVEKYKQKGFKINKENYFKILLSIASLKIDTNAKAAAQLQGMYLGEGKYDLNKLLEDESPLDISKICKLFSLEREPTFGADVEVSTPTEKKLYTPYIPVTPTPSPKSSSPSKGKATKYVYDAFDALDDLVEFDSDSDDSYEVIKSKKDYSGDSDFPF